MIYLDYNSTTPVDPRVLETMLPYFSEKFGNAASKTHSSGWVAEAAVEQARERVAKLVNATPHEIIFTSGATEAINLAIKGVFENYQTKGKHIVTVSTEHKAVLDTGKYLESKGACITYLPVDREGKIDLNQLNNSITRSTSLVCIMYANNETGVIQPISDIAKIVHEKGCILMSDATQAVGKIQVDVEGDGIDLLTFSSHKLYGPKGAGALFVRRKNPRVTLAPLIHGGGHERGLRSGTLNVPAIVGFGKACEYAENEMWDNAQRISQLRTLLEQQLLDPGNAFVNGSIKNRLPNVTNISFRGIKADSLISKIPDIAVSTGSACTSAIAEPSHVLKAMGIPDEMAYSSVRFSLGKYTKQADIDYVLDKIGTVLKEGV
jgi:cysteine desulfurase